MKSFDILTNPNKRARQSTMLGGILSICILFIGIILLFNEFKNFEGLKVSSNLFLDPHPLEEKIDVRFNIQVRSAPCAILSLDLEDDLKHHLVDIDIVKLKLDSKGQRTSKYVKKENTEEQYQEIVQDLNDGIGCEFNGQFQIDKVSGNFHLSFHNYMDHYRKLVYQDHDAFLKLNLSYKILDLSFGSANNDKQDKKIYGLLQEMNLDDDILNNFVDHQEYINDHFIAAHWLEIIPYTFVDNRDGYKYQSYLHSFNRKIKVIQKAY